MWHFLPRKLITDDGEISQFWLLNIAFFALIKNSRLDIFLSVILKSIWEEISKVFWTMQNRSMHDKYAIKRSTNILISDVIYTYTV